MQDVAPVITPARGGRALRLAFSSAVVSLMASFAALVTPTPLMAPSALGAPLGGRFTSATAQRTGVIVFLAGWIGMITAIDVGTLALLIAAAIVAGAGQGIAISAAARGMVYGSTLADRAPIFSVIYLLCYVGAALLASADRPRVRGTRPRRRRDHCPRRTQPACGHDREQMTCRERMTCWVIMTNLTLRGPARVRPS